MAVTVIIALCAVFALSMRFSIGQDCLSGDVCYNATYNQTVNNVTYCCSDDTTWPSLTGNSSCDCVSPAVSGKNWADSTMGQGTGQICTENHSSELPVKASQARLREDRPSPLKSHVFNWRKRVPQGSDYRVSEGLKGYFCCSYSWNSYTALINAPDNIICRCLNNSAPVLPPGAYVVPLSGDYNSSGEPCLYDALCDDVPSLKCQGDNVVYCCYSSRGIYTKNLNASTTGCTCSNEFWGERCNATLKPVASTEQRCLTNAACPPGANTTVVAGGTNKVNVTYCCPNLLVTPYVQVVQGTIPHVVCSCSLHGQDGSAVERTRLWAKSTNGFGRWCESGSVCQGFSPSLTFYRNDDSSTRQVLSLCCRHPNSTYYFAAYKEDYESIGCRCANTSVPGPQPGAYVVPDVGYYNSTGEVCSYNAMCQDSPSVKCESSVLTLCCYGSRGMHTGNLNNKTTLCTCTNDISGQRCEGSMYSISGSSQVTTTAYLWVLIGLLASRYGCNTG